MTWMNVSDLVRENPPTRKEIAQGIEYRRRNAKVSFYTDENFPSKATQMLRTLRARVTIAQDEGLRRHPDENHAAYALKHGFVLLTCDRDYLDESRFPLIHCPAIVVFDFGSEPREVAPPPSPRWYWTRREIAQWLVERLSELPATLVGIDHGFSFPVRYFKKYGLAHDWLSFLDDFQKHWPTDEDCTYVDFVREGECGNGAARCGNPRWRRITEVRAGAKSVFHFDVPGSVAKSTHAGIPWLRFIRTRTGDRVHFWPFDGWMVPPGKSAVVEVYPALWSHSFPRDGRNTDQQDAYAAAEWLRRNDQDGNVGTFFNPSLTERERKVAEIEGWILGIA